jgi:hypothetical protein
MVNGRHQPTEPPGPFKLIFGSIQGGWVLIGLLGATIRWATEDAATNPTVPPWKHDVHKWTEWLGEWWVPWLFCLVFLALVVLHAQRLLADYHASCKKAADIFNGTPPAIAAAGLRNSTVVVGIKSIPASELFVLCAGDLGEGASDGRIARTIEVGYSLKYKDGVVPERALLRQCLALGLVQASELMLGDQPLDVHRMTPRGQEALAILKALS